MVPVCMCVLRKGAMKLPIKGLMAHLLLNLQSRQSFEMNWIPQVAYKK